VRITGKKKDELQETMRLLRGQDSLELDLQFTNFRD
jgi:cyclic-di-GMP-binding protein